MSLNEKRAKDGTQPLPASRTGATLVAILLYLLLIIVIKELIPFERKTGFEPPACQRDRRDLGRCLLLLF